MKTLIVKYYETLARDYSFWPDLEICETSPYSQGGIVDGRPWIKIAISHAVGDSLPHRVYENEELDCLPDIGGFYTDRPEHKLYLHVCHEFSHALQKVVSRERGHGPIFKRFYREIRLKYLNPLLSSQREMQQRYRHETKRILDLAYAR